MIIQDDLKTRLNREFDYSDGKLIRKPGIKVREYRSRVWKENRRYRFAGRHLTLKRWIWIFHYGNIPEGKKIAFRKGKSLRIENLFSTAMRVHPEPTQKEYKKIFDYVDGNLIRNAGRFKGQILKTTISSHGYLRCKVLGRSCVLHRIVWIFHKGAIPPGMQIHHKNHNKLDNRIENLNVLTMKEHMKCHLGEIKSNNTTGHVYISQLKNGRFFIHRRAGGKLRKGKHKDFATLKEALHQYHHLYGYDLCGCTPPENEESKADQMELFQNIGETGVIA